MNPTGGQHGLCELAAQVLFVIVHYLKTVTQLSSLPLSDQVEYHSSDIQRTLYKILIVMDASNTLGRAVVH